MNQEKFGKFIKEIRKKNNLTQQQFANKYNVTYQAVSKWENGKNMPDISLIKQIAYDFDIKLDDMLDGNYSSNKNNKFLIIIGITVGILLITSLIVFLISHSHEFEFKTISSACSDFKITGSLSYNDKHSAIYISSVEYCGGQDNNIYELIDCTLYEESNNTITKISNETDKNMSLEEFLKNVEFVIPRYSQICNQYTPDSLYLEIKASLDHQTYSYHIPLSLKENC